jgi:hypothetical protein
MKNVFHILGYGPAEIGSQTFIEHTNEEIIIVNMFYLEMNVVQYHEHNRVLYVELK